MRGSTVLLSLALIGAAHAQPVVRSDAVISAGKNVGKQTLETRGDGSVKAEYFYNDRDHGDHIVATWSLDASGVPTAYEAHGNDYMKAPVDERFAVQAGKATWKDSHTSGEKTLQGAAFYMPAVPPPEFYGVLARALLKAPDHRLPLLPAGSAMIEEAGSTTLDASTGKTKWTQYRISGLDFTPTAVWLDGERATVAYATLWLSTIAADHEAAISALLDAQDDVNRAWSARMATQLVHVPKGDLVIRNARLFDSRDLSVTPGTSVLVRGDRIVRIAPDADMKASSDAEILDAHGRFLMPGLWDNHQHFDGVDGMLDIANGVTSARDMANDTDVFPKRVERFDAGTEIGPHVLKAGIIDGIGPNSVPLKMLVDNAADAIKDVDWYADHGYAQIKTYMSLKPELVAVIADRAHARGLRMSGHVPAFMSAHQFIEAGADEIQHFNYVELNFLFPEVQETTHMSERFIKVGVHAREFTPDKPQVREFIEFLRRHHTVLDPTMGLLEARLAGSATEVTPGLRSIASRFPVQVRRSLIGGTYAPPAGHEAAYAEAIPAMLKLIKALHDAGVIIVPGTDAMAGYMLHHELELYAQAGIPPAEVLRMATWTSAQVMGVDKDRGTLAPGKLADMILVDGDPSTHISDIRRVSSVIKAGRVYDPAALEKALGIEPRS
jgi:imidazolonepropionase-like amidohydrolase